jgi:hypothetical protein
MLETDRSGGLAATGRGDVDGRRFRKGRSVPPTPAPLLFGARIVDDGSPRHQHPPQVRDNRLDLQQRGRMAGEFDQISRESRRDQHGT